MLPFCGMKRIRRSLKELTDHLMNDRRVCQHHNMTAMSVTGNTVTQFQENRYREHTHEHQRSGQLHNCNSGRQYGYDSETSPMMNLGTQGSSSGQLLR
ncbi:hypothetical protein PoB_004600700 [Plakobranchus ocellatus]|uniref:Uncharacterized protein n=1 Tax=Plakobranchus ocellatus TaxID=259542 RepID=A0AAV4BKR2_9GAST|nr:hypothetical protein PoB_004600700 [Plakobranchus ocellatus]